MRRLVIMVCMVAGCGEVMDGGGVGSALSEHSACARIAYAIKIAESDVCNRDYRCEFAGTSWRKLALVPDAIQCAEAIDAAMDCDELEAILRLEDEDGACVGFAAVHGDHDSPDAPCFPVDD